MKLFNWFKRKEVVQIQEPIVKTVISTKYLKNRLPDIKELNLKARREKLGLTKSEVSKAIGINRPSIYNLENGVYTTCIYSNLSKLHNFYLQEESKINGNK